MTGNKPKICQSCNTEFTCYDSGCWCNDLPMIMPLDPELNCSCPKCLKETIQQKVNEYMSDLSETNVQLIQQLGKVEKPVEGIDYYHNEEGYYVFTSWYHLRRGNCCGNGCKHCPYPIKKK